MLFRLLVCTRARVHLDPSTLSLALLLLPSLLVVVTASPTASRTFAAEASRSRTPPSAVTPEDAQAFFARTLSLPSSAADAAIPADIALQALTHKSYQFVHRISHPPPYTAAEIAQNQASHNGRLSFLGRRALAAYQAMFLHAALGSSEAVREADVLRGRDIESMLAALRHVNNLGRFVGDKWGIESVMRWDRNTVSGREGVARCERSVAQDRHHEAVGGDDDGPGQQVPVTAAVGLLAVVLVFSLRNPPPLPTPVTTC